VIGRAANLLATAQLEAHQDQRGRESRSDLLQVGLIHLNVIGARLIMIASCNKLKKNGERYDQIGFARLLHS
jgi:hypothetical protein